MPYLVIENHFVEIDSIEHIFINDFEGSKTIVRLKSGFVISTDEAPRHLLSRGSHSIIELDGSCTLLSDDLQEDRSYSFRDEAIASSMAQPDGESED